MHRESTLIHLAIALIVVALLGVALLTRTDLLDGVYPGVLDEVDHTDVDSSYDAWDVVLEEDDPTDDSWYTTTPDGQMFVQRWSTDAIELVKAYFDAMESGAFATSCGLMAPVVCNPFNPASVALFSAEYQKLRAGYEYLSVKDFGIVSPWDRDVVCVKYAYRYIDDSNPQLIWEILSFYIEPSMTSEYGLHIATRVCEKKYKEGLWERSCPVQAVQELCADFMRW